MNKAASLLFSEHEVITDAIGLINEANIYLGKDNAKYENIVKELIHFYRDYADKYHHYKEELILFPEMAKKSELLSEGVIKEMTEHHEDFRQMLQSAEKSLAEGNYEACGKQLRAYAEAILDHIGVENDEVFQMLDSLFDANELDNIYFRFEDCDRELGLEAKHRMEEVINKMILETSKMHQ